MTRTRANDGFTIVEVMLVCALSVIVFGATLSAFTSLTSGHRQTELQRDNADAARVAIERAARQLRNLANPTYNATTTIARAQDLDFIFQTSDPAKTWVRYCLQTSGAGATPDDARLWGAESAGATLSGSMQGACPGTAWGTQPQIVAEHVTNQAGGADRNVFEYECSPGAPDTCPANAAEFPKITSVGFDLYLDRDRADKVREMRVSTAVFLRNQNEAPIAQARWAPSSIPRAVVLNGTASGDPEGRTLDYFWFKSTAPPAAELADCNVTPPSALGEGAVLNYTFPATDGPAGTTVDFWLAVRDPGCLTHTYKLSPQVTIPS
jgi:type II secretory pathway pseudopilin PulG